MKFRNRAQAGHQLAEALTDYADGDSIVYALPRGGVVLGIEIAQRLEVPLELMITRKLGQPGWEEYAVGAVTETGQPVWNESERINISKQDQKQIVQKEREEARRRRITYIGQREVQLATGKTAIVVDDGMATGLTMTAAVQALRAQKPKQIVVAIPVAPNDAIQQVQAVADKVVVLHKVSSMMFGAVGAFYEQFDQVQDNEVQTMMRQISEATYGK